MTDDNRYEYPPPLPPPSSSSFELTPAAPIERRRRWPVVAGVIVILAIVFGAIAVTTRGGGREVVTLAEAAQRTQSQHTACVEFTTNLPLPGLDDEALATGEIDFDTNTVRFDLDITEALKATATNVPAGAGKMSAVTVGGTTYMKMAFLDEIPALKGKWMKVDVQATMTQFGIDIDKVAEFESSGPGSALVKMQAMADGVEDLGREEVRGVKTTHYRATYDFVKVYRDRGAVTDEAAFQKLLDVYASTTAVSEAWVDDGGLVRRTVTVIPLKAGTQTVKAEFFDFGVAVNVVVPPEANTFALEDLQAIAGGK